VTLYRYSTASCNEFIVLSKIITQCYNIKILNYLKYIYLYISKLKIKIILLDYVAPCSIIYIQFPYTLSLKHVSRYIIK
jgi:hypothetical protein